MKNVLNPGDLELIDIPPSVSNQINGGWLLPVTISLLAKLLIDEWDTTKKAATDAWNGNYDPPK